MSERASHQSVIGCGPVNKCVRQDEVGAPGLRAGGGHAGRRRAGAVRLPRGRLQRLLPQRQQRLPIHVSPRHEHVLPSLQTLHPKRAESHAVLYPKHLSFTVPFFKSSMPLSSSLTLNCNRSDIDDRR